MAFTREPLYITMQDDMVRMAHPNPDSDWYVAMSQEHFDELVMMRYYNMTAEERRVVIGRVLKTQFETGANGIRKASGLPTVMERVDAEIGEARKRMAFRRRCTR